MSKMRRVLIAILIITFSVSLFGSEKFNISKLDKIGLIYTTKTDRAFDSYIIKKSNKPRVVFFLDDSKKCNRFYSENLSNKDVVSFLNKEFNIVVLSTQSYIAKRMKIKNAPALMVFKDNGTPMYNHWYINNISNKELLKNFYIIKKQYKDALEKELLLRKKYALTDTKLKKYVEGIERAVKYKKPMILVVLHPKIEKNNESLKKSLKLPTISKMIKNNFIYVEYKGINNLDRTQIGYIPALPVTYFFNAKGEIIDAYFGSFKKGTAMYDEYLKILRRMLTIYKIKVPKHTKKYTKVKSVPHTKTSQAEPVKKTTYKVPVSCMGCHGKHFEKRALGKSKIVKNMTAKEIGKALWMYKYKKNYGGSLKDVMQGEVAKYSKKELFHIAKGIKELKN